VQYGRRIGRLKNQLVHTTSRIWEYCTPEIRKINPLNRMAQDALRDLKPQINEFDLLLAKIIRIQNETKEKHSVGM
jgi:hypothetical protein